MSLPLANIDNPFARYADADIFFPVVKRELAGQHKSGAFSLPIDGFQGVYRLGADGAPQNLGVVGDGYNPLPMRTITNVVEAALTKALPAQALKDFDVRNITGRNGAFVKREYRFRALSKDIEYGGRYGMKSLKDTTGLQTGTTVAFLASVSTSYDGSSSIRLETGGEDLVCMNGLVMAKDVDAIARRHTKNAGITVQTFADIIAKAVEKFGKNCELWQSWAAHDVTYDAMCDTLDALPGMSGQRAKKLREQVEREIADRGSNVYAFVSALTYYSSHSEGSFAARNTGNDNVAETLVRRKEEVNKWLRSDAFQALAA